MNKKIFIHAGIVLAMLVVSCIYFSPVLEGKIVRQGDIQKADAMSYAQRMEKEETGSIPNWSSSMFSGMPGYQIASEMQHSVFNPVRETVMLRSVTDGWERNIGVLFLYLLGFYVAMLVLGVSPWIGLIGALAFGLGSYNIIIIEAGHITKAWAMSMMAPILAGMMLVLRTAVKTDTKQGNSKQPVLWGTLLFTLALILQISFNHIQITFYTAIGCVMMGIAYLAYAIVRKQLKRFALTVGLLALAAALAFGCNARLLLVNEEYAQYTMRGGNELTVTPASLYGESAASQAENTSDGLDINYAFSWSYGVGETYTLLVPGAVGGGSLEKINSKESEFYNTFMDRYYDPVRQPYPWGDDAAPLYWGGQPFTSGPVYFGAIVFFLFILGMIVVKGPERWWLLAASLVGILLSWGGNFMALNGWLFEHIPLYNKFRTPSMALVLTNVCFAIMAVLTLRHIFSKDLTKADREKLNKGLYIAAGSLVGLILVVLVAVPLTFTNANEGLPTDLSEALIHDRASLFSADSWRSIIFILLAAAALWLYNNEKIKKNWIAITLLGALVVIDLWTVDRRYLNKNNFVEKDDPTVTLNPEDYDYTIDAMAATYNDKDYRVYNLATNTFNDSKPSAFHHQIGGYSAAKLSRYQNLIDFYISRYNPMADSIFYLDNSGTKLAINCSNPVLNMLNARYMAVRTQQGVLVLRNTRALGSAWFVDEVKTVGNADEEILALNGLNPATTAIVDTSKWKIGATRWTASEGDTLYREATEPQSSDICRYHSKSRTARLAVFSEVHYAPDWFAYIDGKPAEYIRVNFILRGLEVPAGDHVIEFKNEAPLMHKLDTLTLIISIVTLLAMVGAIVVVYCKKSKD